MRALTWAFDHRKPSEQWQILSKAFDAGVLPYGKLLELTSLIRDDDQENINHHKRAFAILDSLSSTEKRQELWQKAITDPEAYSLAEWEYIFKGFNNEFSPEQYEPFVALFFENLQRLYTETNWNYFQKFYKYMFPKYSEDFVSILEKIQQVLAAILANNIEQKGSEALVKLLKDSLEETRRRRSCFALNVQQDNLKNSFLETQSPTVKVDQPINKSIDEAEEESKLAAQIVIENLENIVKTEEDMLEAHEAAGGMPDFEEEEDEEEEEEKVVINRSWKKHDTVKVQLTSTFFKDWVPNNKKKYAQMFKKDSKRFNLLQKQFASNQKTVKSTT